MEEDDIAGQLKIEQHSDWLWSFLVEHTGEDQYFDLLLGRLHGEHPPHPQNVFEKDRLILFRELVDFLIELRGAETEAADWLFNNPAFERAVGISPFQYLEDGEFQALSLLRDWVLVACLEKRHGRDSFDAFFGKPTRAC